MWFREIAAVEDPGRRELQAFVDGVLKFLKFVLEHREEFPFLWEDAPELRELAIETFRRDVSKSADELRRIIPDISNELLVMHGLIGRPAKFKFRVVNTIANLWDRVRPQKTRICGWFKQMTEAIDAILKSLTGAAGGIGGVLEEFKDTMSALAGSEK
jgi:hypothetical protein